jgi:hypothetical protein
MTLAIEEQEPALPFGLSVDHKPMLAGEPCTWLSTLRWCGLWLDNVIGTNRKENFDRLRERMLTWGK